MKSSDYKLASEKINRVISEIHEIRNEIPLWQKMKYWNNRHIYSARFDWAKFQFKKHLNNLNNGNSIMGNSAKKIAQATRICNGYSELFCKTFKE